MGALHAGHLNLVAEARRYGTEVLVSIFVNPAQFNNAEDLRKYPRTVSADLRMLQDAGATAVFIPTAEDLYPAGLEDIDLDLGPLASRYEGYYRPGHFDGVVKVLHRLFSLIRPVRVFFGLKDLQQCLVVEKLIGRHFPAIIQHNVPTLREENGLAMSSRNTRLSAVARQKASAIFKVLRQILSDGPASISANVQELKHAGIDTEYLELVNLPDMEPAAVLNPQARQAAVFAGYLEGVRLIDNLTPPKS